MRPFHRSFPGLLLACAVLAAVFDFFFRPSGPSTGWVRGAYLLLVVLAARWRGGRPDPTWKTRALTAALLGLAAAFFIEPSRLAVLLSFVGLAFFFGSLRRGWPDRLGAYARVPARFLTAALGGGLVLAADLRAVSRRAGRGGGRRLPALPWKGISILAGFGILFAALFVAANPVLERGIRSVFKALEALNVDLPRLLLWGIVFSASWGAFRLGRKKRADAEPLPADEAGQAPLMAPGLLGAGLAGFNVLFAAQTATDAAYLWGGAALPEGMTFAAYAHRGAYPLVLTTLLAAAFVLMSFREGDPAPEMAWPRRWVYAWMAQNVFLTLSSIWRLHLYVESYGLTRWRLAAFLWMGLVAAGIVLLTVRVLRNRSNAWLCRANAGMAAALLYVCCFPDFDGFIARHNVSRCREVTGAGFSVDLRYLSRLGPAALPALERLRPHLPEAGEHAARIRRKLLEDMGEWRAWTWRRWRVVERYLYGGHRAGAVRGDEMPQQAVTQLSYGHSRDG